MTLSLAPHLFHRRTMRVPVGMPVFSFAVRHIISLRAGENVRGIATRGVITVVTSIKAKWVSAVQVYSDTRSKVGAVLNNKKPSPFDAASRPRPTFIRPANVNLSPKAGYVTGGHFWYRLGHGLRSSVRSVLERWKRCQHMNYSRFDTWQQVRAA